METIQFKIGNHTDVGLVREKNEDYYGSWETANGYLLIVCDGMGGHVGGDIASRIATEAMHEFFNVKSYDNIVVALQQSFEYANTKIRQLTLQNPQLAGMGTTAVVAVIRNNKVFYGHVGDSRLYLFSQNRLMQLTKDHSFVQQLVDGGLISSQEAESHPRKNQILKALGISDTVEPTICEQPYEPKPGDYMMLCTDGLSGQVNEESIKDILLGKDDVQKKVIMLIDAANNNGGPDNSTVQMVYFDAKGQAGTQMMRRSGQINYGIWLLCLIIAGAAGVFAYKFFSSPSVSSVAFTAAKDSLLRDSLLRAKMHKPDSGRRNAPLVTPQPSESGQTEPDDADESIELTPDHADTVIEYQIQKGDDSVSLKKKFNISWSFIKLSNQKTTKDTPAIGTRIRIQILGKEKFLEQQNLDSLLKKISNKYQIGEKEIKEANDWIRGRTRTNGEIIIPVKGK